MKRMTKLSLLLLIPLLGFSVFYTYWSIASPQKTCASCHELQTAYDDWTISSHRDIRCENCHGTALSSGVHSLVEKGGMVVAHFAKKQPEEEMALSEVQVIEVMNRCRSCHRNEFAAWTESGHSATYSNIFLNEKHNSVEQPYDDCLRCHGMFFEAGIDQVVQPRNNVGPWHLVDQKLAERPVIPCLACHKIHSEGVTAARPDHSAPQTISYDRLPRLIKSAFYDRHEKSHFASQDLPTPQITHQRKPILISDDPRQRLCSQCHAPNAFHQSATGDDRTPRGVHEGLSCLTCHETHSHDTRLSCGECHPALSNCGLDVTAMNTTFADPNSPHNIHFVACSDCHSKAKGI